MSAQCLSCVLTAMFSQEPDVTLGGCRCLLALWLRRRSGHAFRILSESCVGQLDGLHLCCTCRTILVVDFHPRTGSVCFLICRARASFLHAHPSSWSVVILSVDVATWVRRYTSRSWMRVAIRFVSGQIGRAHV